MTLFDPRTDVWNEHFVLQSLTGGTVEHCIQDDTPPGDPHPRTIVTEAPFDRFDREQDHEVAWAEFERRFAHLGALS